MEILDDYSLLIIFKMLHPLDWLNVNRVCRRWNKLSALLWGSELCLSRVHAHEVETIEKIDYNLGVSIIKNVAPGVKTFESSFKSKDLLMKIRLNSYTFCSEDLTEDQVFKILSTYSYKIVSMDFTKKKSDSFSRTRYFKRLIRSSSELKILKLGKYLSKIIRDVRSSLEVLHVNFYVDVPSTIDIKILKRICPELTTLNFKVFTETNKEANELMHLVAACAPNVVNLYLSFRFSRKEPCQLLDFVLKFPHLQKLTIKNDKSQVSYKTISQIVKSCTDLRQIEIEESMISVKSCAALFSLPKMENLDLNDVVDMPAVTSTLPFLLELRIKFSETKIRTIRWDNLIDSIKMMPNLAFLHLKNVPEEILFRLVKEACPLAIKRGLDVIVINERGRSVMILEYDERMFAEQSLKNLQSRVLVIITDLKTSFLNTVADYVRQNFSKYLIKTDNKKKLIW